LPRQKNLFRKKKKPRMKGSSEGRGMVAVKGPSQWKAGNGPGKSFVIKACFLLDQERNLKKSNFTSPVEVGSTGNRKGGKKKRGWKRGVLFLAGLEAWGPGILPRPRGWGKNTKGPYLQLGQGEGMGST